MERFLHLLENPHIHHPTTSLLTMTPRGCSWCISCVCETTLAAIHLSPRFEQFYPYLSPLSFADKVVGEHHRWRIDHNRSTGGENQYRYRMNRLWTLNWWERERPALNRYAECIEWTMYTINNNGTNKGEDESLRLLWLLLWGKDLLISYIIITG